MAETSLSEFERILRPLWMRSQSGDEVAYESALKQIASRLRGYLSRKMTNNLSDVEDLVQEILLAVHLQRGTYDASFPVSAWVYAIARHKLIDFWRRRGRRENLHDEFDEMHLTLDIEPQETGQAGLDLNKLLGRLPEAQGTAIKLTKIEGLSIREAARQTGSSEVAIKVQIHRGLKRLMALVRGGRT